MAKESKLTPRQEKFCLEYIKDLNGAQAAVRAGYAPKNADVESGRLLVHAGIKGRIAELKKESADRIKLEADDILRELLLLAKTDLAQAYDKNGHLLPIHEIPEETRRAMAGIKVYEEFEGFGKEREKIGEVREVKFYDKTKALELLGKHLKLFTDKVEHSGKVSLESLVAGSMEDIDGKDSD